MDKTKRPHPGKAAVERQLDRARHRQEAAVPHPRSMEPDVMTQPAPISIGMGQRPAPTIGGGVLERMPQRAAVFGEGLARQMSQPEQPIVGVGNSAPAGAPSGGSALPVGHKQLEEYSRILNRYKAGKASVERRVQNAERWWKIRNSFMADVHTDGVRLNDGERGPRSGFRAETAWLHNVIVSKHADALEAYPHPNILPREQADKPTAWALSKILPVVLRQNGFERTYDEACWSKLKTGTAIYKVVWDPDKLNGLGDISISRVDLLNVFWEPGVSDIQDSRYIFHAAYEYEDDLRAQYPELGDKPLSSSVVPAKMPHDDHVDMSGKVVVIDVYYKRKGKLHYCKYVGDNVLYSTENDPARADKGLYDHGKYPFVFDTLYPIEDCPAGYGYVDICANPQMRIDILESAFLQNAVTGATPRYFSRSDGAINEDEFLDLNNPIVHVSGNLNDDSIRPIQYNPLHGNYANLEQSVINELRETSGNTETSTGSSTNGVTAASALAALQEASGKGSRASTMATYRCFSDVVFMVIELIRQFYDAPRIFRITGDMGEERFIPFSNGAMLPEHQGMIGTLDLGYRTPVYDIEVVAEKRSTYTRLSQNELALQFYSLGFFNPNNTDQALSTLKMMDFDGKEQVEQMIAANGTMFQQLQLYQAMAATLAAKYEPEMMGGLLSGGKQPGQPQQQAGAARAKPPRDPDAESSHVANARARTAESTQPN